MSTQYVKGDCIFIKENKNFKQYNYLTEDIECDVLVVGGGVTGAIMGHYLTKSNINTVIIEKSRVGHCSTSITTSLLQYELDSNARELKANLSEENIVKAYDLGLFAIDEIDKMIKEIGNDCYYKRVDCLLYTSKNSEVEQMKDEYNFRKQNGFHVELITENPNPYGFDIKAGVRSDKGGAVLDPFLFAHSLIKSSCENGMRIYENTEAVKIMYENDYVIVETEYGYKIKCKKVVAATGYNTKLFTDRNFGTKYTTFNIATKPVNQINSYINDTVFRDNNDPYHYFRTTHDNRIIIGGEDVRFVPDIDNEELCNKSYENLEKMLCNIFKDANNEVEYKYCGAFAVTKDNLGFIGVDPDYDKLWYCLGYGANGILFAILGGYFLSKLYFGEKDKNMSLFKVNRFDK